MGPFVTGRGERDTAKEILRSFSLELVSGFVQEPVTCDGFTVVTQEEGMRGDELWGTKSLYCSQL